MAMAKRQGGEYFAARGVGRQAPAVSSGVDDEDAFAGKRGGKIFS